MDAMHVAVVSVLLSISDVRVKPRSKAAAAAGDLYVP